MTNWKYHLDKKHKVILDNDGWWFAVPDESTPFLEEFWVDGGDGPYGQDLLLFVLREYLKVEVEFV